MKTITKLAATLILLCSTATSFAAIQVAEHTNNMQITDDYFGGVIDMASDYIPGEEPKVLLNIAGEDGAGQPANMTLAFTGADLPLGVVLMNMPLTTPEARIIVSFADKNLTVSRVQTWKTGNQTRKIPAKK